MIQYFQAVICILVCALFASTSHAELSDVQFRQEATTEDVTNEGSKKLSGKSITHAMRFVKAHHPELHKLLKTLRGKSADQFEKALRPVHDFIQRLESLESKNRSAHDFELAQWKLKSRIRVAAAKLATAEADAARVELQDLITQKNSLKREYLQGLREKMMTRIDSLDKQLESLDGKQSVENQLARFERTAKAIRKQAQSKPEAEIEEKPSKASRKKNQ